MTNISSLNSYIQEIPPADINIKKPPLAIDAKIQALRSNTSSPSPTIKRLKKEQVQKLPIIYEEYRTEVETKIQIPSSEKKIWNDSWTRCKTIRCEFENKCEIVTLIVAGIASIVFITLGTLFISKNTNETETYYQNIGLGCILAGMCIMGVMVWFIPCLSQRYKKFSSKRNHLNLYDLEI